jgi:hypothetical protein
MSTLMTDEEYEARAAPLLVRLSRFEAEYNLGHKYELFDALVFCARYQIVIPEWAADALLNIGEGLTDGEEADINSAFGWGELPKEKRYKAPRKHNALVRKNKPRVIEAMFLHRLDGGSLNADVGLREIAKELGLSPRVVESIYQVSGKAVKDIPLKNLNKEDHILAQISIPQKRRVGRKLICGCKEET